MAINKCDCAACKYAQQKNSATINIQELSVSMARFALSKDSLYSVSPPKTKGGKLKVIRHQECGNEMVPASNNRMACCYCLKTGYLIPAPDTSVGSDG